MSNLPQLSLFLDRLGLQQTDVFFESNDGKFAYWIEHIDNLIFKHCCQDFSNIVDHQPHFFIIENLLSTLERQYPGQKCHFILDMNDWNGSLSSPHKFGLKKHRQWLDRNYGSMAISNTPFLTKLIAKIVTIAYPNPKFSFHKSEQEALGYLKATMLPFESVTLPRAIPPGLTQTNNESRQEQKLNGDFF